MHFEYSTFRCATVATVCQKKGTKDIRIYWNHTKLITVNRREIVSKLRLRRPGFETKVKGFMTLVAVVRWCIGVDGMTG